MTPPALPGEAWRTASEPWDMVRRTKQGVAALWWDDEFQEWIHASGAGARAILAAWAEHERARADAAEAERDAARGVAQLAAEERDALRKRLARAQAELDAYRDERRGRATP